MRFLSDGRHMALWRGGSRGMGGGNEFGHQGAQARSRWFGFGTPLPRA